MGNIIKFGSFSNDSTTEDKDWIKDTIKKPGALKKEMGEEEDETIGKGEINKELGKLKKKDKDPDKKGVQGLNKKDLKKLRRLQLAKTLRSIRENKYELNNYHLFENLVGIKKMIDDVLAMDPHQVDILISDNKEILENVSLMKRDIEKSHKLISEELKDDERFNSENFDDESEDEIEDEEKDEE